MNGGKGFNRLPGRDDYEALSKADRTVLTTGKLALLLTEAGMEAVSARLLEMSSSHVGRNGAPGYLVGFWQDYCLRKGDTRDFLAVVLKREVGGGLDTQTLDFLAWLSRCLYWDRLERGAELGGAENPAESARRIKKVCSMRQGNHVLSRRYGRTTAGTTRKIFSACRTGWWRPC